MTITQVIYFLHVSGTLSLTKTAEEFNVSIPAVSKAVRDLEKEYNVTLFSRAGNHLVLTEEGMAFAEKMRVFIQQYQSLQEELHAVRNPGEDKVLLGFNESVIPLSYPVVGSFLKKYYPQLKIEYVLNIRASVDAMRLGQIDAMMIPSFPNDSYFENYYQSDIQVRKLGVLKMKFYCSRDVFYSPKDELNLSELEDAPLVLYKPTAQMFYVEKTVREKLKNPNIAFTTPQIIFGITAINYKMAGMILAEGNYNFNSDVKAYTITDMEEMNVFFLYRKAGDEMLRTYHALQAFLRHYYDEAM